MSRLRVGSIGFSGFLAILNLYACVWFRMKLYLVKVTNKVYLLAQLDFSLPTKMHHEKIKAEMRIAGKSPAALARELRVSRTAVSSVMAGNAKSQRIADAIAKTIGRTAHSLWPTKYPAAGSN